MPSPPQPDGQIACCLLAVVKWHGLGAFMEERKKVSVAHATLAYAVETGVAHGTLILNANGTFTYTPNANYNGNDSFTYTVTDAASEESATHTVNLAVTPVNDAPAVGQIPNQAIAEDETVTATALDVAALIQSLVSDVDSAVAYVTVSGTDGFTYDSRAGGFSYTPDANFHGTVTFTVIAHDAQGAASPGRTFTLTVDAVDDLADADDTFSGAEDTTIGGSVAANASTTSGGTLAYAVETGVSHGTLIFNANGTFTYTPNANYNGNDSFTYTVTDAASEESATHTVNLAVTPVNDAPTITSGTLASFAENGTGVVYQVSATDIDTLGVTCALSGADAGYFNFDAATGKVTFKAAPDFENPRDGGHDNVYNIVLSASDGQGGVGTRAIDVTVTNVSGNIVGTAAGELLAGTTEEDTINALGGDDLLKGGLGKDALDGGIGVDTADYSDKTAAVVVTLNGATNANVTVGGVVEDTVKNIENLIGGSASDKLTGDGQANRLDGGAGADIMRGGAGNDVYVVDKPATSSMRPGGRTASTRSSRRSASAWPTTHSCWARSRT